MKPFWLRSPQACATWSGRINVQERIRQWSHTSRASVDRKDQGHRPDIGIRTSLTFSWTRLTMLESCERRLTCGAELRALRSSASASVLRRVSGSLSAVSRVILCRRGARGYRGQRDRRIASTTALYAILKREDFVRAAQRYQSDRYPLRHLTLCSIFDEPATGFTGDRNEPRSALDTVRSGTIFALAAGVGITASFLPHPARPRLVSSTLQSVARQGRQRMPTPRRA